MNDEVKKAAEQHVHSVWNATIAEQERLDDCMLDFIAGAEYGFARAVKMLREFKDERNSLRIQALHMAAWLEEQEKG